MTRMKLTGPALFVALLLSWPALEHGLVDGTLSTESMLIRVGVALVVAMIGRAFLSAVVDNYRLQNLLRKDREEERLSRRSDDEARQGS